MNGFTHLDEAGNAVMVDVSGKNITAREAIACGKIEVGPEVMKAISTDSAAKGDVLAAARIAGIFACKKVPELIPLCHSISITKASVDFELDEENSVITAICTVKTNDRTGVEMEALTGCNIALLTIYDMCKAINKAMVISDVHLLSKSGGKSGDFVFPGARNA